MKQFVIVLIAALCSATMAHAQKYLDQPGLVRDIIADGNAKAGKLARETMRDVRAAMGLNYS